MNRADALAVCEATVRRSDPDRYFASLFAAADKRPLLFALYAFNHELARAGETAREPLICDIRLSWWHEALEDATEGRARAHPASIGLIEILSSGFVARDDLASLIDARQPEAQTAPFATLDAMESHAGATGGALMRIAVGLLGAPGGANEVARHAGIAYGLAGMLRSVPFHAARGKHFLPLPFLEEESAGPNKTLPPTDKSAMKHVIEGVRVRAFEHFAKARLIPVAPDAFPALLPAALVPAYLSRIGKASDPLKETHVSQLRRQLILLRASLRGRL